MVQYKDDDYGSFGGIAISSDLINQADIILQSIPYESGTSGKKGTSFAPSALRMISKDMQLISRTGINLSNLKLVDKGNISINPINGEFTRKSIYQSMKYLLENSSAPIISIGGDHSITFPLIQALADTEKSVGIIWFDAHRDLLNEFLNSKYSHGSSLRRCIELPKIDPENVLLVGTRYFTSEEEKFLHDHGIGELKQSELEKQLNPIDLMSKKVQEIASRVDSLYFSIDIDGLDPAFAPGTGTPVAGGMSSSDFMNLINKLPVRIRAFDLVEISPSLDPSGITIKALLAILTEILAQIKISYEI
ncbi:MAG: agmatinase [Candidatus Lokiarchaeota archaeon]|nr:agmatinase [Candidatus Lokiarchaeota archaeon]